jgi:hypothetical protein
MRAQGKAKIRHGWRLSAMPYDSGILNPAHDLPMKKHLGSLLLLSLQAHAKSVTVTSALT